MLLETVIIIIVVPHMFFCGPCKSSLVNIVDILYSHSTDDSYLLFANHYFINRCNLDGTNLITLVIRQSGGAAGMEFDLS